MTRYTYNDGIGSVVSNFLMDGWFNSDIPVVGSELSNLHVCDD